MTADMTTPVPDSDDEDSPLFSGPVYDKLKFVALVVLPAVGTLYAAVAGLWGLPAASQVVGTIMAIDAFMGVLLHISTKQFQAMAPDGYLADTGAHPDTGLPQLRLEITKDYKKILAGDTVKLKVGLPPGAKP